MRLTHLGHSCLLIETHGKRLLVVPGGFSDVSGVRDLEAILVTHQHPDHIDPAALLGLIDDSPEVSIWLAAGAIDIVTEAEPDVTDRLQQLVAGQQVNIGEVRVTPVGDQHAVIHDYVPQIDNLGLVIEAEGEPRLFHPGDALDVEHPALQDLDILCVPINAPWASIADTVAFVRRIAAPRVVPIHDGLLNDTGRGMYLGHIERFGLDGGVEIVDLRGRGPVEV